MAMVVKNNMSAVSTLNTLNKNSSALQKSLQKVSSGMKINSAQDDASGYAISEKMRVQIRSLDQANQNTQNASSMMKTAEGAVSSTVEILKSLKEKAINAATDTNTDSDRVTIQKELDQFIDQIDDNALTTFNGKYLVDGSKSQLGKATHTAMTNQSLQTGTDGATALTALHNRNNESLEIESTDYVTASFVKNGKTYTTKFLVGDKTTLDQVFGKMNEQYDNEQAAANIDTSTSSYKSAFAGKADNTTDTSSTTTSTDTAASPTTSVDTGTTFADVTSKVNALKAAVQASSAYTNDMNGNAKTYVSEYIDTLGASDTTGAVAAYAAPGSDANFTDSNGNKWADIPSAQQTNINNAMTETAVATAVTNLQNAITTHNNAVNGTGSTGGSGSTATTTPSSFQSVNGDSITKANADNYIMSSEDVDKLAATYNVSRAVDDTDETYAAKVLYAAIDKGTEKDGDDTAVDRGAANKVTYTEGTFNSVADKDGYGAVNGAAGSYDAMFLNPDKVVDTKTGKMLTYSLSDTAPVAGVDYKYDSDTKTDVVDTSTGIQSSGAAAIQDAYNRYVGSTALGNGTTYNDGTIPATVTEATEKNNIKTAFDDISKLANHLSALNAKNADADGIVNTVTTGDSIPGSGDFTTDQTTETGLIGVNSSGDKVYTADGTEGLTITANESGVNGQISGVTLSISDSEGNVKKSANAALDAFKTTIYAKNKSDSNELSFQVGGAANQSIAVGLDDMRSEALGLKGSDGSKVSVATQDKANAAVAVFDNAIQKALDQQTTIGAVEARLEYTSQNLTTSSENVQAAESTIRDADMAKEMTNYTKNNVLLQAAQSMLAQANQSSSQVLSLLQ